MKRIVTLLLAAGLVMGAYTGAQAADVKVSGKWNFGFHVSDGVNYAEGEDDFNASQRLRLQLDIIASENLKGVVFFEIGNSTWGVADGGADLGADDKVVEVKRSYIDWTAPNTDLKIRMGVQGLALPAAAFGNPIFDEDVAAVTMSYAFNDTFALTGFWARPYDGGNSYGSTNNGDDEMDMFGLIAPISLDGHAITPYFVYANIGKDAVVDSFEGYSAKANGGKGGKIDKDLVLGEDVDVYYAGVAYSMTAFDPFTLDVDFIYGAMDSEHLDQSGWMVDFKAAYALDFMTPALIGWYASGADEKGEGVLPTIPGQPGCWYPTSFGFVGSCYEMDTNIGETPNGSWAIGLELADISFIEDLTHVFRFVYMEGTNDKDFDYSNANSATTALIEAIHGENYLTEDDSAVEINFDSTYQIYENLAFILELGYINFDYKGKTDESAYKAGFNFVYSF